MIVRPKRIYRKRIPYGMQNFEDVIKEDCYFGLTIITQFDYSFLDLMAKIILYLLISKTFSEKLLPYS